MKIAYNAQIFLEQTYGGISRYFCEIAPRISNFLDTEILITAPIHINSYLEHLPSQIVSGFRLPPYISRLPLNWRGSGMVMGDILLRLAAPDIIHETYFCPFRFGPRHARRVLTIYDMIHEKFSSDFDQNDETSRNKLIAAKRADHIICISESTRTDLIELMGINPSKISVIYLGFGLMNDTQIEATEPFEDKSFLLYVGARRGYKNFIGLLNAFSLSARLRQNFKLVCFGGGDFSQEEHEAIGKFGLNTDSVIQMGGNDHLLATLYKAATAFIYPSLYEGFGIPPLEAMSFDCPVICSNKSSIPEVVGDAGEYFDPYDIDNIRVAIEKTVESVGRMNELKEKGRQRLNLFSWDHCAKETSEVYRKLL